jgi:hypothetical protein
MNDKKSNKNNELNNEELFVNSIEGACSPEFSEGCIMLEDDADGESDEK